MPLMSQGIGGLLGGLMGGDAATQGAPAGLEGLFANLMGAISDATTTPTDTDLAALLASLKDSPGAELPPELFELTGADSLQVNIQAVFIHVQQTIVQLQQSGFDMAAIGNGSDLAAAFTQLGMDPAVAVVKATQIETMLQLVKDMLNQDTADSTLGNLMAMMAASSTSLTPMLTQQTITVDVTQVDIHIATAAVQRAGLGAFKAMGQHDCSTLARQLAHGLPETTETVDAPLPLLPSAEAIPASLATDTTIIDPAKVLASLKAQLTEGDDDTTPEPVATEAAPTLPALATPVVEAKPIHPHTLPLNPTVSPVEASAVLDAPKGIEVARLTESATGEATLERTLTPSQVREAAPTLDKPESSEPTSATPTWDETAKAAGSTSSAPFAEKLAHATRADVTRQTVVQVKELAGQGGGIVRMILNPPELGEIRIEMVIRADKVEGTITATDNAVVELLARDVHSLKQGLADAGLKLGESGLSLMLGSNSSTFNQHSQSQQGQNPQGNQQHAANWLGDADGDATTDTTGWVSPDRIVDVRI
ncbi:MAG: flagellar hook-length control protein FliK [Alphaproteobacteria bacterium]